MNETDRPLLFALLSIPVALLLVTVVGSEPVCASRWILLQPFCAVGTLLYQHREVIDAGSVLVTGAFTFVLAISTIRLWKETKVLAQETKQSITLAQREFISTHRPRIILREAFTGSYLEGEPIHVVYQIANIGETSGTIVRSTIRLEVANLAVDRLLLHPSVEPLDDLGEITLKPGEARLLSIDGPPYEEEGLLAPGGPKPISERVLHFLGQFIYRDDAGIFRRTAFRRALVVKKHRFYKLEGEPDLDYSD